MAFRAGEDAAPVPAKLEQHVRTALAQPDVRERFVKLGLHPIGDTSAEFTPFVADAISAWAKRRASQALKRMNGNYNQFRRCNWQVL